MNKKVSGVALTTLFCGSGCAQQPPPVAVAHLGHRTFPLSPEQEAAMAAKSEKCHALDMAGFAALDAGRYAEAEANAREVLALGHGSDLLAPELLAAALDGQGKADEALQAYKALADRGTVFPRNLLPYALLLLKTGHWAQAVEAYNKQLPYLAEGDLMQANSAFSPAMPQPRELETAIHVALGLTYNSSASWDGHSQDEKALAEYRKALALAPDSPLANYGYGCGLKRLGHRDEAMAAFAKAARFGGDDIKAAVKRFSP